MSEKIKQIYAEIQVLEALECHFLAQKLRKFLKDVLNARGES